MLKAKGAHCELVVVELLKSLLLYGRRTWCKLSKNWYKQQNSLLQKYLYYGIPVVENNGSVHSGVGILVENTTPHQQLHINTGLQAIALRATCHKTITICSIYLSPSTACNDTELEDLIGQLPPPVLLLGDFNAHS